MPTRKKKSREMREVENTQAGGRRMCPRVSGRSVVDAEIFGDPSLKKTSLELFCQIHDGSERRLLGLGGCEVVAPLDASPSTPL